MTIRFVVLGKPQPAGSKRAFVNKKTGKAIVTDDNKKSKPWKQEVAWGAVRHTGGIILPGPLRLEAIFVVQRPKGHYRTGKNAHLLKDSAPVFPTVKPDTTKLLRGLEDALTGVLWRDDAQVVEQFAEKRYGPIEGVIVTITELDYYNSPGICDLTIDPENATARDEPGRRQVEADGEQAPTTADSTTSGVSSNAHPA